MASHFSSIGFDIASTDDVLRYARSVPAGSEIHRTAAGDYIRLAAGGAELWFQRSPAGELIGMNPHFDAATRTPVRRTARLGSEAHPLDGGFHLWLSPDPVDPETGDPEIGASPLFVDVPDFRVHDGLDLPIDTDATIAAFAHTLDVWADEAELRATGSMFAAESLVPSGLFHPGGDPTEPPRAEAILNGVVEAAEERVNQVTGLRFVWARVRTYGARVEIVADPSLPARPPVAGDIVGGTFWMSARFPAA